MQAIKTTIMDDPNSFKTIVTVEVSQRALIRVDEESYPSIYQPPMMSIQMFEDLVGLYGTLSHAERYICHETVKEIYRALLKTDDTFIPIYLDSYADGFYKADAMRVISSIQYIIKGKNA